ncbi:hypothetical protein V5O48_012058 [Marasmius crinis-equi]|uniref:Uncharacterized protein n=1 Tax=Marasmius crinis-equi TaxID=585013 RepID=A0ABR3F4F5_9AGAR
MDEMQEMHNQFTLVQTAWTNIKGQELRNLLETIANRPSSEVVQSPRDRKKEQVEIIERLSQEGWQERELRNPRIIGHPLVLSMEDAPEVLNESNWQNLRETLVVILQELLDEEHRSTVKFRTDMLRTVYEPYRRRVSRGEAFIRIPIPPLGDFMASTMVQGVCNLIDDAAHARMVPRDDLIAALDGVDFLALAKEWTAAKEAELKAFLGDRSTEYTVNSAIFRRNGCTEPIVFPRILLDPFFINTSQIWDLPSDVSLVLDEKASFYARQMLGLCNLKTLKDVERINPIFECLDCGNAQERRLFIRWLAALEHDHENHELSIASYDEKTKSLIEQAEVDLKKGPRQIPYRAVRCNLRSEYPSSFDRLKASEKVDKPDLHGTIEKHLSEVHSIAERDIRRTHWSSVWDTPTAFLRVDPVELKDGQVY